MSSRERGEGETEREKEREDTLRLIMCYENVNYMHRHEYHKRHDALRKPNIFSFSLRLPALISIVSYFQIQEQYSSVNCSISLRYSSLIAKQRMYIYIQSEDTGAEHIAQYDRCMHTHSLRTFREIIRVIEFVHCGNKATADEQTRS